MPARNTNNGEHEPGDEDERPNLRQDAETLVQATESAWRDLLPQKSQENSGTQTDFESTSLETVRTDGNLDEPTQFPDTRTTSNCQLERWDPSGEDAARWLYRLVFAPT